MYNNVKHTKDVPPIQVIQNEGIPNKFNINPIINRRNNEIGVNLILPKNILYKFLLTRSFDINIYFILL